MNSMIRFALVCTVLPTFVRAQEPATTRVKPDVARVIDAIVDNAVAAGLPPAPLRNKALEGASKGADGDRIIAVVRHLRDRLATARDVLGPGTTEAEYVAAAAALDVGASPASLAELRTARPGGSIAGGLVGLVFLVQRGAASSLATGIVRDLLAARATDLDFDRFRHLVEQDVRAGAPVGSAAQARARAFVSR
jgi:hypothetical protein